MAAEHARILQRKGCDGTTIETDRGLGLGSPRLASTRIDWLALQSSRKRKLTLRSRVRPSRLPPCYYRPPAFLRLAVLARLNTSTCSPSPLLSRRGPGSLEAWRSGSLWFPLAPSDRKTARHSGHRFASNFMLRIIGSDTLLLIHLARFELDISQRTVFLVNTLSRYEFISLVSFRFESNFGVGSTQIYPVN